MNFTQLRNAFVILSMFFLVACGGGGGGSTGASSPGSTGGGSGGTSSAGLSTGVITGFGSVFVNGVEYDTTGATFTVNGKAATEHDLKLGMVVTVHGNSNGTSGKATAIEFDHDAEGPVGNVDAANGWLEVLGQTVVVDNLTVFDGTTLDTIAVGNVIEVSGWPDANNLIHATRIEFKKTAVTPGVDEIEVEGTIANLDNNAKTFTLRDITVAYGSASGVTDAGLSNGQFVEVSSTQGLNTDDQLVATRIEVKDTTSGGQTGQPLEVQGLVTRFASASDFTVNNQSVRTTSSTQFEGTPTDLALNAKVIVTGTLDANGVLLASKVTIQAAPTVQLEGNVAAVDTSASTITVSGQTVKVDATTQMLDTSPAALPSLTLADIAVGDHVIVVACPNGATLLACRLERTAVAAQAPPPGVPATVALLGTVDSVAAPDLVILGVRIVTSANTTFKNGADVVSSSAFFGAIATGDTARAMGTWSTTADNTIVATSLELMVPASTAPSMKGTVTAGANRVRVVGSGVYFDNMRVYRPISHGSIIFSGCTPNLLSYTPNGNTITAMQFDGSKLNFKTAGNNLIASMSLAGCGLQGPSYDGPFTSLTSSGDQLQIWNGTNLVDTLLLDQVPAP